MSYQINWETRPTPDDGLPQLNAKHADRLAKALQPFVAGARKVSATRRTPAGTVRHDQLAVREWAHSPGVMVNERSLWRL